MTQLVLFNNADGPGPDEFIVIDEADLDEEGLEEEYGAKVVTYEPIFLNNSSAWPTGRGMSE